MNSEKEEALSRPKRIRSSSSLLISLHEERSLARKRMRRTLVTKKERIEIKFVMNLEKEEALNRLKKIRSSSSLLISLREERSLARKRMRRTLVTKKETTEIRFVMNLEKEEVSSRPKRIRSSSSLLISLHE